MNFFIYKNIKDFDNDINNLIKLILNLKYNKNNYVTIIKKIKYLKYINLTSIFNVNLSIEENLININNDLKKCVKIFYYLYF